MTDVTRRRLGLLFCLAVACACFGVGIDWGLPSRAVDPYLFGDQPVWGGRQILELSGGWGGGAAGRGSDVDQNPLAGRDRPVVVNETDAQRAEVIQRYRLYTYQPDELVTMRALASMNPAEGKLDPKAYQYGGLWVYPVGALLKIGSMVGAVHLTGDLAYYLDRPEAFGRFYVVARLYSALWGLVGAWAVFETVRRLVGGWLAPTAAALCYAAMPVVINTAHEAKPHLAGAVLTLLAVLAADTFIRTGRTRWWVVAGAVCGAAFGMVLTGLLSFAVLPVMALMQRMSWGRRLGVMAGAVAVGLAVYAATNPYVPINLARGEPVLASNAGNTAGFYRASDVGAGFVNAARLIAEGTSEVVAVAGAVGAIGLAAWAVRRRRQGDVGLTDSRAGWLLLVPALLTAAQMAAFGAGKPAEYGRFGVLPDVGLMVAAVVALTWLTRAAPLKFAFLQPVGLALLVLCSAVAGGPYLWNFVRDAREITPRLAEAQRLREIAARHDDAAQPFTVATGPFDPAPFSLPPVDLFRWRLVLLPRGAAPDSLPDVAAADVIIQAIDHPPVPSSSSNGYVTLPSAGPRPQFITPISWAAKPFRVLARAELLPRAKPPPAATESEAVD